VVLVSPTLATEEQHAAAVLTALNTALTSNMRAYDYDEVPATRPDNYVEVTVSRRFGGDNRAVGSTGRVGWRITTRPVAKTVSNAREMRKRVTTALNAARVTVSGDKSTPIQFEGEEPIGPDDGWYSGLSTWTYAI
jgi:hypothetical protein